MYLVSFSRWLQGYQGLVDGGDNIQPATWESVSMMLQLVSDDVEPSNYAQKDTIKTDLHVQMWQTYGVLFKG